MQVVLLYCIDKYSSHLIPQARRTLCHVWRDFNKMQKNWHNNIHTGLICKIIINIIEVITPIEVITVMEVIEVTVTIEVIEATEVIEAIDVIGTKIVS